MDWSEDSRATDNSAPSPDIATYSPKFYSVSEELRHDPNRYSPLEMNGWKLFGEYPKNPT